MKVLFLQPYRGYQPGDSCEILNAVLVESLVARGIVIAKGQEIKRIGAPVANKMMAGAPINK